MYVIKVLDASTLSKGSSLSLLLLAKELKSQQAVDSI